MPAGVEHKSMPKVHLLDGNTAVCCVHEDCANCDKSSDFPVAERPNIPTLKRICNALKDRRTHVPTLPAGDIAGSLISLGDQGSVLFDSTVRCDLIELKYAVLLGFYL
ncbi:hypothetical protein H4S08_001524 [Coemansia sp. RSA 1365]|nr:hypothetical protein H4S08_001524 [Coemansia sp. RSA 1365]